jgi:hypothetical protein
MFFGVKPRFLHFSSLVYTIQNHDYIIMPHIRPFHLNVRNTIVTLKKQSSCLNSYISTLYFFTCLKKQVGTFFPQYRARVHVESWYYPTQKQRFFASINMFYSHRYKNIYLLTVFNTREDDKGFHAV